MGVEGLRLAGQVLVENLTARQKPPEHGTACVEFVGGAHVDDPATVEHRDADLAADQRGIDLLLELQLEEPARRVERLFLRLGQHRTNGGWADLPPGGTHSAEL